MSAAIARLRMAASSIHRGVEVLRITRSPLRAISGGCDHYHWLCCWSANPDGAEHLAAQATSPPHPHGGHWAKDGLLAAAELGRTQKEATR